MALLRVSDVRVDLERLWYNAVAVVVVLRRGSAALAVLWSVVWIMPGFESVHAV